MDAEKVSFKKKDVLVVDASDDAIESRQTDRDLIKTFVENRVRVYSLDRLHAKIMVFDRIAVVGSTNLSQQSQKLTEAAVLTNHSPTVSEAREFVQRLAALGDRVDGAFIDHLMTLEVKKAPMPAGKLPPSMRGTTWLLGTSEIDDPVGREGKVLEDGLSEASRFANDPDLLAWIRFGNNKSSFVRKAKRGDQIIEIWHPKSGAVEVWRDAHIRLVNRHTNWTHLYVEYLSEDVKSEKSFKALWRKCDGGKIPKLPCRAVTPDLASRVLGAWEGDVPRGERSRSKEE